MFFLPCLKWPNTEANLDKFKQFFFILPIKGDKYEQKKFSQQNEPHTSKPCLSVVLKHFGGNS